MKIRVLVVEDKMALNQNIVDVLEMEGYLPYSALDFDEGKRFIEEEQPDIVLLDIMLPGGRGYDLIPYIKKDSDSHIIMLTALNDEESKCLCYENGADDYITKPFNLQELVYKLGAISRRIISNQRVFHIGDITFNMDTSELCCHHKRVALPPSQLKLLKLLYEKYQMKSYLDKKEVFHSDIDESRRIQTFVGRLRDNLTYVGSLRVSIETLYGKGYQLEVMDAKRCKA